MVDFNKIIISGRLANDSEIRATKNGKRITAFNIAVNDDYKKDEKWEKRTYFFNVVYSGEKDIIKETKVIVEGKLSHTKVENEDKTIKHYYNIFANKVMILLNAKSSQDVGVKTNVNEKTIEDTIEYKPTEENTTQEQIVDTEDEDIDVPF